MSTILSDSSDVDSSLQRQRESDIAESVMIGLTPPKHRFARKYLATLAVGILYGPHYGMLWILGPRWGMYWVRLAAMAHWMLTFFGAQRMTRRALEKLYPQLETGLSVRQLLYRHLELKHECFARVRVYNARGPKWKDAMHWQLHPSCRGAAPNMKDRSCGLMMVGYHYGFFQLSANALSQFLPECNPVQLRHRVARSVEDAMPRVARFVLERTREADRRSGAPIFYVDADTSFRQIYRLLRNAGCLSVAADGMSADDFVDVPFFDGTLRVPIGWARLAAATSSDVTLIYDTQIDRHRRYAWLFNTANCSDASLDTIKTVVAEAIHALEIAIRREPWSWHPWQRLRWEQTADGSTRYSLKQFGEETRQTSENDSRNVSRTGGTDGASTTQEAVLDGSDNIAASHARGWRMSPRTSKSAETAKPRVAIVCNSLTPYRVQLHERLVEEVPEVELWSLATHSNAYNRWQGSEAPKQIRPVNFSSGEPSSDQARLRYSVREWLKGGRIIEWINKNQPAAVICQGCGDMGRIRILHYCRLHKIPCFLYGDFNICGDRHIPPKRWLKRIIYRGAVNCASGLMPCGIRGKELLERYGGRDKPYFWFPFVPDADAFEHPSPSACEAIGERFGFAPNRRRIVFSARMMRTKRPDLALHAFVAIADDRPNWDLVMLGDGELRSELEKSVPSRLRQRITWTGFLHDTREVAALYSYCDLLLLPSEHEPWGVVVAEAAAAGLAIVASNVVGAAPELVQDDRNGYRFPTGDRLALTQALRRATSADWIDAGREQSRTVFREWYNATDPVSGFRAALTSCGILHDSRETTEEHAEFVPRHPR